MRTLLKNVWLLDNFYCVEPANILIEEERIASVLRDEQAADHIVDLWLYGHSRSCRHGFVMRRCR